LWVVEAEGRRRKVGATAGTEEREKENEEKERCSNQNKEGSTPRW
jgi:hypothetical protein